MKDNRIRVPMIASIILQSIAVIIGLGCYFLQGILRPSMINLQEKVFPLNLVFLILTVFFQVIVLLTMQTYEGESRRGIGIIFTIVYCLLSILMPYITIVSNMFVNRRGAEFVAAQSMISSSVSLFTSPLSTIASALTLIAIGRYGISQE